jgi:predicted phosphodiesterase
MGYAGERGPLAMRYALISDVHANLEALTAVLTAIAKLGADSVLCLGDMVGRFANPNEVVALIRNRKIRAVAGNHDLAAAGIGDDSAFNYRAKRSTAWTKAALTEENARFLRGLPIAQMIDDHLLLVHAALHPRPNNEVYLTSSAHISRSLKALAAHGAGARIACFGHTHVHAVHRMWVEGHGRGRVVSAHPALERVAPDSVYLINPGSVGQPRDGDLRASFAIYDRDHALVQFHRVAFDHAVAEEKARRAGLIQRGEEYLE